MRIRALYETIFIMQMNNGVEGLNVLETTKRCKNMNSGIFVRKGNYKTLRVSTLSGSRVQFSIFLTI